MNLQRKTISFKNVPLKFYAYGIFLIIHIALFNVNVAEWGDSYRILRASEFIRQGTYPKDEKRPPLFSIFTATRIENIDAVLWGRVVMLIFSLLSFYVFDKFSNLFIKEEKLHFVSLILFTLNPVFLYWSIRIMADVPFTFFVLLFFYLIKKWNKLDFFKIVLLGLLCGLAILTRFEGYLLFISGLIAVIFHHQEVSFKKTKIKEIFNLFWANFPKIVYLGLTTLLVISPWLLYRNPLKSRYFKETETRVYDFKTVWVYFSSLFFLFGFTSAFFFIFKNFKKIASFLSENVGLAAFIVLELVLILLWPAAIPRLFVPLIPFFIVILSMCISEIFLKEKDREKPMYLSVAINIFLILLYIFSQFYLKLQFLILSYKVLALVVLIQIIATVFLFLRKNIAFLITIFLSITVWGSYCINMHRNIFKSIKEASEYSSDNLVGKIAYNDTSAIPQWYLNVSESKVPNTGKYMFFDNKEYLKFDKLRGKDIDYIIVSNEHDPNLSVNIEKRKYLQLIKEFSYNVNGTVFFAKVIKFDKNYTE